MLSLLRSFNQNFQSIDKRCSNVKEITDEILICSKTLEELLLDSNHIKSLPKGLFRFYKLKRLTLSDNELVYLPPAIAELESLEELNISKNGLREIPYELKHLKHLEIADFSCNPLYKLPSSVIQIQSLVELRLNNLELEELPSDFGRLINLRTLELRDNKLKSLPSSFVSLGKLECLDLGSNIFEDMPSSLCQLKNLVELWLDCNEITSLPKDIENLKNLMCLDITENDIQSLPVEFSNLENLTDFYASQNYIDFLPSNIGQLSKLTVLKVDDNRLTSLPKSIGNCVLLRELNLKENDLSKLPSTIGNLKNLVTLIADCNRLIELPSEICYLSRLGVLSLRDNCLCFLPEDIGKLTELQVLDVCGNRLQYLPTSILNISLKALWLSENQNQPLLKFQKDIDWKTKKEIVTCYMFPQQGYTVEDKDYHCNERFSNNNHIMFDVDDDDFEKSPKLVRHGTPYAKELKTKLMKLLPQKLKAIDGQIVESSAKEHDTAPFRPQRCDSDQHSPENEMCLSKTDSFEIDIEKSPCSFLHDMSIEKESGISSTDELDDYQQENLNCSRELTDTPVQEKQMQSYNSKENNSLKNEETRSIDSENGSSHIIRQIVHIFLHREPSGLGLSIAGGKESPPYKDEDDGIFISKIIKGGPADKAGLKIEDKLLKVNDVSMINIDHYTAVQVLKNAGDNIKLTCLRELNIPHSNSQNNMQVFHSFSDENFSAKSSQCYVQKDISLPENFNTNNNLHRPDLCTENMKAESSQNIQLPSPDKYRHVLTDTGVPDINVCGLPLPSSMKSTSSAVCVNNHLSSFEPDMTSTPISISRASNKIVPDLIQPTSQNIICPSRSTNHFEGPLVTVTIQSPKPYVPLKTEFPPVTKALGETVEVLTKSSYTETTATRVTNNITSLSSNIEEVTLTKLNGPLGLSILGGADQSCLPFGINNPGIFISRIVPNGTAAKTGKIRVGDRVLKVNDIDLRKATHSEAVSALSMPVNEVTLLIQHDPLPDGWQEVVISKMREEFLGIDVSGGINGVCANPFDFEDEGIFITKIHSNSAASKNERLKAGMRVIEVNGISLLGATCEEAINAMCYSADKVTFVVCNGFNIELPPNAYYGAVPESSSVTIDSIPCIDSDDDSLDHHPNTDVIILDQKSIDEKVLDVVRAAERLVNPLPQFSHQDSKPILKTKKKTTIVLAKHTVNPSVKQAHLPEPAYLPCEV